LSDATASPPAAGVLAFGDSITHAGGELQWGVALQSWALWVARGLGLPYTGYAVDGARAPDVVQRQIPAFLARHADREARFDLGCLYIGVNDVRAIDWDPDTYSRAYGAALDFLAGRCHRVLTASAPLRLGVPPAGTKVLDLNAIIAREAARRGALIVELGDFGARNHVMADRVHPTAFGQIAIAERALTMLAADGLVAPVSPASLISYRTTRIGRLRGDMSYVYRDAKLRARGAAMRWRLRRGLG
jgi:lysophospholipase L1-like esterase